MHLVSGFTGFLKSWLLKWFGFFLLFFILFFLSPYLKSESFGADSAIFLAESRTGLENRGQDLIAFFAQIAPKAAHIRSQLPVSSAVVLENVDCKRFYKRSFATDLFFSKKDKVMWVATRMGLEKRDAATGEVLKVHTAIDGLVADYVMGLALDDSGELWATPQYTGLSRLLPDETWLVFNTQNSGLPTDRLGDIVSDGDGGLWIATEYEGLCHMTVHGEYQVLTSNNSELSNNSIKRLVSDGAGGLWIGTHRGVNHLLADGTWRLYLESDSGLLLSSANALVSDGKGGMWAGTSSGLVHLSADGQWEVFDTQNSSLPYNSVNALALDSSGGIWVGTSHGLAHLSGDRNWRLYDRDNSGLTLDNILSLALDHDGGLWVGINDWGANLMRLSADGSWQVLDTACSGLPNNHIHSFSTDGSGGIWAATDDGLFHVLSDGSWETLNRSNSELPRNYATSVAHDGSGGVWAAIWGEGLAHFSANGAFRMLTKANSGLRDHSISCMVPDGQGGLWIATTSAGLGHMDMDGSWQWLNKDNSGLASNYLDSFAMDRLGGLWVGVRGQGLAHMPADGEWKMFTPADSDLPDTTITSLAPDDNGGMWIGVAQVGGLCHVSSTGQWTVYKEDNSSLPGNHVQCLAPDGWEGLWVGTTMGLGHLMADGSWQVFTESDSQLPDNDVRALMTDDSGALWVGTQGDGFAHLTFGVKQRAASDMADAIRIEQLYAHKRAAILIHPRPAGNLSEFNSLSAHVYHMLQTRGYDNDEIRFLSHTPLLDVNNDGFVDKNVVDGPVTAFQAAAGTPAIDLTASHVRGALSHVQEKGALDQPLIFIFMGTGSTDGLRLDPDGGILTFAELDAMLDDYQAATGNPVILVLEAGFSKDTIQPLLDSDRAVIAGSGEDAMYGVNRGMLSFGRIFFSELGKGSAFGHAYGTARQVHESLGGPFGQQLPFFMEPNAGQWSALSLCLNECWTSSADNLTLEAQNRTGRVNSGASVNLTARAERTGGLVQRVWAVVLPPKDFNSPDIDSYETVVNLIQRSGGIWTALFSEFDASGDFRIVFMAKDTDGFVETSNPVILGLNEDLPNIPPYASGDPPLVYQSVYGSGDRLQVGLPWTEGTKDQYVALFFPNGTGFFLTDANTAGPDNGRRFSPWTGDHTVLNLIVPPALLRGDYTVFLLRLPQGLILKPIWPTGSWDGRNLTSSDFVFTSSARPPTSSSWCIIEFAELKSSKRGIVSRIQGQFADGFSFPIKISGN